jgi:hypothetical protein
MCQSWQSDFIYLFLLLFLSLQRVRVETSGLIHFRIKFRYTNLIYYWYDSLEGRSAIYNGYRLCMTIKKEVNAEIHDQSGILTHNTSVRVVKESMLLMQRDKCNRN